MEESLMVDINNTECDNAAEIDLNEIISNEKGFLSLINQSFDIESVDIRTYNPLTFAFIP